MYLDSQTLCKLLEKHYNTMYCSLPIHHFFEFILFGHSHRDVTYCFILVIINASNEYNIFFLKVTPYYNATVWEKINCIVHAKTECKQNESISAPYYRDIAIQGHSGVILLQQAENACFRE